MSRKTAHVRANNAQLELMVSYMEEHTLFARGQITSLGRSGHDTYKRIWSKLADQLNQLGRVQKDETAWLNCWKRLQLNAKERKAKFLSSLRQTGNNSEITPLNELDERITNIFGEYGTGLCIIPEIGVEHKQSFNPSSGEANHFTGTVLTVDFMTEVEYLIKQAVQLFEKFEQKIIIFLYKLKDSILNIISQRVRSTKAQYALLLSFMERNPVFAKEELDIELYNQQWTELVDNLNAIGVEFRTVEAWKRTWNDKVRFAREKKNDIECGRKKAPIPADDLRILKIFGEHIILQPKLSTSFNHSNESLKRPLETSQDKSSAPKKFVSESQTLQIATANNEIINKLSKSLIECFKEQNKILEKGLDNIQKNIFQVCSEIIQAFNLYKETSSHVEYPKIGSPRVESPQVEYHQNVSLEVEQDELNEDDESTYPTEYLHEYDN